MNDLGAILGSNLTANHNGLNGVEVQIISANNKIDIVRPRFRALLKSRVSNDAGSTDYDTLTAINLERMANTSNFISMNNIKASFNGGIGVIGIVHSTDTVVIEPEPAAITGLDSLAGDNTTTVSIFQQGTNQNWVNLDNVTANNNGLSGTMLIADTVNVHNSTFMYNGSYGLEPGGVTNNLINVRACHNRAGPLNQSSGSLFTDNFNTINCLEGNGGNEQAGPEFTSMPWQIIKVYTDPGKNNGTLSCQFGTTFLYLEKKASPASDFEWGRVELAPCVVPGGTVGTLTGLAQGSLPGALPDGVTFQGKAFDFELTGAGGSPVSLGGAINVRFTLPAGFTLPSGKKLAILWFDPTAKQWVELTTYAGGTYANAYASKTGAFVLTLK